MIHGNYIRANLHLLKELPPPGEEWCGGDVDIHRGELSKLHEHDAIRPVGRNEHGNYVWETDDHAYSKIQDYL